MGYEDRIEQVVDRTLSQREVEQITRLGRDADIELGREKRMTRVMQDVQDTLVLALATIYRDDPPDAPELAKKAMDEAEAIFIRAATQENE